MVKSRAKPLKNKGWLTEKDHKHGLFGNDKSTHKDVIGKLNMGQLTTAEDRKGLTTKKDHERGLM